jgi:hypothetical protein
MNRLYPYTGAQILTDAIFRDYGHDTASTTALQRQAAYEVAEKMMANNLSAFAPITTVTGTYAYPFSHGNAPGRELWLWWKFVQSVDQVTFIDTRENRYYTVTGTDNVHVGLRNPEYGILDIFTIARNCACVPYFSYTNPGTLSPYQVEVVYQAGLPTGTYTSASYLMSLTTVADVILNEFGGCGNESSPFVGITRFSNQQYSETRMGMYSTALGANPRSLFAYGLVKDLQRSRHAGL